MNIKKIPFLLIFLLFFAIIIRFLVIRWSLEFPLNGDFLRYEDWARIAHIYGLADTYKSTHLLFSKPLPNNQPPGTLYILSGTYEIFITVSKLFLHQSHNHQITIVWLNNRLLHIFMRLPALIADVLLGIIAYFLVKNTTRKKYAIFAASFIWFNPVIIYNSAAWGQLDSLNNFFFLLSLFCAFQKKYFLSVFSFALSLYIKLSLLPLLPFYVVFLFFVMAKDWKKILFYIFVSIMLCIIFTFPVSSNPLLWLTKELQIIAHGELQNITSTAFNFWWSVTCLPNMCKETVPAVSNFLGISLSVWGYVLFFTATLPFIYFQIKQRKFLRNPKFVFLIFSLVALCIFVFLPKMHDRYLYPFFPLFPFAIFLGNKIKTYLTLFIITILVHMANLLYSWYPTYFPSVWFYYILYNKTFTWILSIIVLGITFYLVLRSYREIIMHKQSTE